MSYQSPRQDDRGYYQRQGSDDRGRQQRAPVQTSEMRRRSPERNGYGQYPQQGYDRSEASSVPQQGGYQRGPQSAVSGYSGAYSQRPAQPYQQPANYGQQYDAPPPQQQYGRKRTVRQIPLTPQGNLVIDVPVADRVAKLGKYSTGDEFTHMRYTAVTCTPDEFPTKGYSLRQQELQRQTELFIVVTMYNEDDYLFCKTMQALMKNIAYLCSRSRSKVWGDEGWKKAVICIVSDGRAKINSRVLDVLGIMGVYQNGIMKDHVNQKPVTGHLFEYTTQVCVTSDLKVQGHENGYVPIQILFCLKEKNAKKINSHRWFFNAFGPLIRPNVCILIDVGTKPTTPSLYHLWKAFERDSSIGGACGEIYAELGTGCVNLLNPLVAAQNFEYKMSNILDKPLESVCGYISVLPGAFSAYRYLALQGKPLEQYFKGEALHGSEDIFAANMYLAEDRILCFEIVTKANQAWLLKYVKSAQAETDVPDNTPEFISQRRRWLNGSFFATVHSLTHWFYIFRSGHNIIRKTILVFEFIYNLVNVFFAWFNLSFFYLTFYYIVGAIGEDDFITSDGQNLGNPNDPFIINGQRYGNWIFPIMREFYLMCIVITVVSSLGNRPQGSKFIYNMIIFLFALIMAMMIYLGGFSVYQSVKKIQPTQFQNFSTLLLQNAVFRDICISTASTLGLYIVASCLYFDPWHMITSFIQYMLFLPSFSNILNVYAFCNLHDVSWGTKGDNSAAALGGVSVTKGKDGKETVEVEMITDHKDINTNYEKFIKNLNEPRPNENKKRDANTKMEDYFKNFRTRVVLSWIFSNAIVIILMTNQYVLKAIQKPFLLNPIDKGANTQTGNPFLEFIFWSVAGLSLIRAIGSFSYLILRAVFG
ncbi:Chitin synthase, class 2 [Terramyces sp. JEL0728]|nr:Chitin synthase, class 2 [Terramyces sp. JEL0728]